MSSSRGDTLTHTSVLLLIKASPWTENPRMLRADLLSTLWLYNDNVPSPALPAHWPFGPQHSAVSRVTFSLFMHVSFKISDMD